MGKKKNEILSQEYHHTSGLVSVVCITSFMSLCEVFTVSNDLSVHTTEYSSLPRSPYSSVQPVLGFGGNRCRPYVHHHALCVSGGRPCVGRRPGPAAGWERWWGPSGWPVSGRWRSRSQEKTSQRWHWTPESEESGHISQIIKII